MTATTHRGSPRRGARPRVLLALLLLALAAGSGLLRDSRPAGAAPSTPGQTAAETPRLELRGQTAFVAPKDTLELKLALHDPPADSTLSFELQAPITNKNDARAQLDASIAGKTETRFLDPKSVQTAFVPTDAAGVATVKLEITPQEGPQPEFGFRLADGGVYPLIVTLAGADQAPLGRFITYLIRLPSGPAAPDAPPLGVAGILPFRAPLAINTQGQSTLDDDGIKRLSEITRVAQAHRATPLTISPNAETIAALALTGDRAGANSPAGLAQAWTGHEVLTSTFVPVDVDAWLASQMEGELRQQLRLGSDTVDDLSAGAQPFDERTWLADPTLAASGVHELRTTGRDRAVLPPDSVAPLDPKTFKPEQAQVVSLEPFDIEAEGTRTRAVATDDRFRSRFSATANPALNAQIAMADLAVLYFGADRPLTAGGSAPATRPRSVTAILPEDLKSLAAVDAFLTALERPAAPIVEGGGRPIFAAATVDTVLRGEAAPANPSTPRPAPGAPVDDTLALTRPYTPRASLGERTMGTYPQRLAAARVSLAGYDSMVRHSAPEQITLLEQLIDVSGSAQLNAEQRQAYLDAATATVASAARGVRPLPQENVTITDSRTELALNIQNDNPHAVDVKVALTSDKMQFPEGDQPPANSRTFVTTLQPGLNKVPVEVSANTSGEIQVTSRLSSPDDRIALADSRFTVRSTLISGLGLALSIGAGFFLLVWWARNFRKTRRANKLVPDDPTPPDDPARVDLAGDVGATDRASDPSDPADPLVDLVPPAGRSRRSETPSTR